MRNRIWALAALMVLAVRASAANVETDRTWYLAGEAMKVSVTASDALIGYAELCDTRGLVAGTMMRLLKGEGSGVIQLPSDLHSGYYVLSAYTRNGAKVAHRLVAVVNPLRKSDDDDIEWMETTRPDSVSYASYADKGDRLIDSGSAGEQGSVTLISSKAVDMRETEGHIIKARVKSGTFRGSDIRPSLSIIGKQIHYFEGKMVSDSLAVFFTYGVSGRQPLVLAATTVTGESLPIELISPFDALLPKRLPRLVFHYNRSEVEVRSLGMQRRQLAMAGVSDVKPLPYRETLLGTKPDLSYNLDEYRQFLTVREVILEYVLCVRHTKTGDVSRLIVRKEDDAFDSSLPTLVLIDGMPVTDVERLLGYDARRVHYINIYGGQYTFGHSLYNGILSFVTRSGQLTNYPTEPNMQYLVYDFP